MGIAKLYGQKRKTSSENSFNINGIIEDYYVYAGENISAGDFVEFVRGVSNQVVETSVDNELNSTKGSGYANIAVLQLDTDRVLILHLIDSTNYYLAGMICTFIGTKIIPSTDTQLNATKQSGYFPCPVLLDDGRVFIAHGTGDYHNLTSTVCSISGTTITVDTTKDLSLRDYSAHRVSAVKLEGNKVYVLHSYASDYHLYGIVCTISGNTISIGTDTSIQSSNRQGATISAQALSGNEVFVAHSYGASSSATLYGMVSVISGTTFTHSANTQLCSSARSGEVISVAILNKNLVFIAHSRNTDLHLYGMVVTVNGTNITLGTDTLITDVKYTGRVLTAITLDENTVFIAHGYDTNYYLYGVVCDISGTAITPNVDTQLNTTVYTAYNKMGLLLLKNGAIVIAYPYSDDFCYLHAQMFRISEEKLPITTMTVNEQEIQVRKATRPKLIGLAKTSGMGAYETVEYTLAEGETATKGKEITCNVENTLQEDLIPKTWTQVTLGTEYVAEDGTRIVANGYREDGEAKGAFDGNIVSYWVGSADTLEDSLIIEFPKAVKITKIKVNLSYGTPPDSIQFKGYSIEKGWVVLYDFPIASISELTEFTLNNTDYYTKYGFFGTHTSNTTYSYLLVKELQTSEYSIFNTYEGTALQSGKAGDTIQLAVPLTDEESTGHNDKITIYQPRDLNLINNDSFEDFNEWVVSSTEYLTHSVDNGILTIKYTNERTTSNLARSGVYQILNYEAGHQYYVSAWCWGNGKAFITNGATVDKDLTDEWELISGIYTSDMDKVQNVWFGIQFGQGSTVGDYGNFIYPKVYDLTAMFGEGNEPTKTWCDKYLNPVMPDEPEIPDEPEEPKVPENLSSYNLVTNGNFSNSLTGWSKNLTSGVTTNVSNNILTITTPSVSTDCNEILYQDISLIGGHIYYYAFYGLGATSNKGTVPYPRLRFVGPWANTDISGNWVRGSAVGTPTEDVSERLYLYAWSTTAQSNTFKYRDVVVYDLTAIFGAGSEPTKEWCDKNL